MTFNVAPAENFTIPANSKTLILTGVNLTNTFIFQISQNSSRLILLQTYLGLLSVHRLFPSLFFLLSNSQLTEFVWTPSIDSALRVKCEHMRFTSCKGDNRQRLLLLVNLKFYLIHLVLKVPVFFIFAITFSTKTTGHCTPTKNSPIGSQKKLVHLGKCKLSDKILWWSLLELVYVFEPHLFHLLQLFWVNAHQSGSPLSF